LSAAVQSLRTSLLSGSMKAQWNAGYAVGSLLGNAVMRSQPAVSGVAFGSVILFVLHRRTHIRSRQWALGSMPSVCKKLVPSVCKKLKPSKLFGYSSMYACATLASCCSRKRP
jgi:hypothetical protein